MATPNDQTKYQFNVFTGELDIVVKFNPDRIVTSRLNAAGNALVVWDPTTSTYLPAGPDVVINNAGNVVVVGN